MPLRSRMTSYVDIEAEEQVKHFRQVVQEIMSLI